MLELQLQEIGARLSGGEETPCVAGTLIVEGHAWADSSLDLQFGLEVVELGAVTFPLDPADPQAP